MSSLIFGCDPESLAQEGLEPTWGSIRNDLMVQSWEEWTNQQVSSRRDNEHFEHLNPGDTIDYRSKLTRWWKRSFDDELVLKLTFTATPGLETRDEIVLGECQLKVVALAENVIEVSL